MLSHDRVFQRFPSIPPPPPSLNGSRPPGGAGHTIYRQFDVPNDGPLTRAGLCDFAAEGKTAVAPRPLLFRRRIAVADSVPSRLLRAAACAASVDFPSSIPGVHQARKVGVWISRSKLQWTEQS